jgi:DNA-binding NtrC family response regulator
VPHLDALLPVATVSPRDPTILVVDDEEDTANLLCELLQRRGYHAEAFTSASLCLEYLRTGVADVVITDVQMPGLTGIELCRELHVRHPDVLAIVLTGLSDLKNAIHAGAYDVLRKPVPVELLEVAINRALEHRALRREVDRLRRNPVTAVDGVSGTNAKLRTGIELTRGAATSEETNG